MGSSFEHIDDDNIAYKDVIAQLQHENEELRVKLTQAMKSTPLDDTIDGIVVLVRKADPIQLYVWVCIGAVIAFVIIRLIEVLKS